MVSSCQRMAGDLLHTRILIKPYATASSASPPAIASKPVVIATETLSGEPNSPLSIRYTPSASSPVPCNPTITAAIVSAIGRRIEALCLDTVGEGTPVERPDLGRFLAGSSLRRENGISDLEPQVWRTRQGEIRKPSSQV